MHQIKNIHRDDKNIKLIKLAIVSIKKIKKHVLVLLEEFRLSVKPIFRHQHFRRTSNCTLKSCLTDTCPITSAASNKAQT